MKRLPCKAELAAAIRAGRKTETRCLCRPQQFCAFGVRMMPDGTAEFLTAGGNRYATQKPRYRVGEIVGIAEPWTVPTGWDGDSGSMLVKMDAPKSCVHYLADGPKPKDHGRIRLARFLPDAFVRTRVEIASVEAQRVRDITARDVIAEGLVEAEGSGEIRTDIQIALVTLYADLWNQLHPDHPCPSNPWVWRYTFKLL